MFIKNFDSHQSKLLYNILFFLSHAHTTHTTHCSHPIDVVKTRLQVSGDGTNGARNYKALGIRGTVAIIATEVSVV
jgi:Mitochondrial carrier protein